MQTDQYRGQVQRGQAWQSSTAFETAAAPIDRPGDAEDRLESSARRWGKIAGWTGAVVAGGAFTAGVTVLALHKRNQVTLGSTAAFIPKAENTYTQCYQGTGYWDDIASACAQTQTIHAPDGQPCGWDKLWYMAQNMPQVCLELMASQDTTNAYNRARHNALNYFVLMLALPVVMPVAGYISRYVGYQARKLCSSTTSHQMGVLRGTQNAQG